MDPSLNIQKRGRRKNPINFSHFQPFFVAIEIPVDVVFVVIAAADVSVGAADTGVGDEGGASAAAIGSFSGEVGGDCVIAAVVSVVCSVPKSSAV